MFPQILWRGFLRTLILAGDPRQYGYIDSTPPNELEIMSLLSWNVIQPMNGNEIKSFCENQKPDQKCHNINYNQHSVFHLNYIFTVGAEIHNNY